jgi:hypothetical protein
MKSCSNIPVANAVMIWAATTAHLTMTKPMAAMNSYPQLQKVIHSLWESPKNTLNVARYLTRSVRSRNSGRAATRIARTGVIVLSAHLCLAVSTPNSMAIDTQSSKDNFKLYLHTRVVKDSQYQCAYKLYMKESKFDSRAINGSHYGIPQMRNKKLLNLDGYRQIDWGIRYIAHRYKGDYCLAWAHFKSKGWH